MATSEPVITIRWRDDNPRQHRLHVVRHRLLAGHAIPLHRHDFAEVFWIEAGGGGHACNGCGESVEAGDCRFLRPRDRHRLEAGPRGLTLVNVSFLPADAAGLAARHGARWPWRAGEAAPAVHLWPTGMERLHAWTDDLAAGGGDLLDLDAFLCDIVRLASRPQGGGQARGLPAWLAAAVEALSEPANLRGGTLRLAALAGRGTDHVNRTVRAAQGRTATELVTALRLERAAAELRLGWRPVAAIAAGVGLANLGYFYHLFAAAYGCTPARYRRAAQQVVTAR